MLGIMKGSTRYKSVPRPFANWLTGQWSTLWTSTYRCRQELRGNVCIGFAIMW
ncbi:hypothetical protein Hanom_Chr11g01049041 [Helianthus anomalus]